MAEPLQQLDLFGFPINPAPQKVKKERGQPPVVAAPSEASNIQTTPASTIIASIPALGTAPTVVYENENIGTRIKAKKILDSKKPNKRGRKSFREMDTELDLIDVPEESILNQKLYYSISEVAGWFKVNTSLLRYWENEFDILQPRKTRKGDRLFRVEDVKNLQLIYFLLRQRKFSIEGAKNYLKNNKAQADMQAQLVQSLTKFKNFLLELKSNLTA